jgi:FkbM family methyltransferase
MYDLPFWRFLESEIRPGDRVVDVGANVGLFSIAMARAVGPFGHVFAFEPDEELFELLKDNIGMNWLDDRVTLHNFAVTSRSGSVTLHKNLKFRMLTSAGDPDEESESPLHREFYREKIIHSEVRAVRLDEIIDRKLPIRLIKIDVEGGESAVLDGMQQLLNEGVIEMIDLEIIRSNSKMQWRALRDWIRRLQNEYCAEVFLLNVDGSLRWSSADQIIALAGHFPHVVFRIPANERIKRSFS